MRTPTPSPGLDLEARPNLTLPGFRPPGARISGVTARAPTRRAPMVIPSEIDGRYKILEKIGEGGMGQVFKGWQISVERAIAVKFLRRSRAQDANAERRFFVEARTAASLRHPNTVTVFDFGRTDNGLLYMAMELLEGHSLSAVLNGNGRLPPLRALRIAMQVADALAEAHEKRLVHRDLKPDNIHIEPTFGNPDFVKVLDFGVAKAVLGQHTLGQITTENLICGTPLYMSPEMASTRGVGPSSDIYSLGIILYEMLVGQTPFQGPDAISVLKAHQRDEAPRPSALGVALPRELEAVLMRMLAKRPEERWSSTVEVGEHLRRCADAMEMSPHQVGWSALIPDTVWGEGPPGIRHYPTEDAHVPVIETDTPVPWAATPIPTEEDPIPVEFQRLGGPVEGAPPPEPDDVPMARPVTDDVEIDSVVFALACAATDEAKDRATQGTPARRKPGLFARLASWLRLS